MSFSSLVCLSVVLVMLQASAAPLHSEVRGNGLSQAEAESRNFQALPIYKKTVKKILSELSKTLKGFSSITCNVCKYAVGLLQSMFNHKMSYDAIAKTAAEVCYLAKIEDKNVCEGITHIFKEEVLTVFDRIALSPEEICAGFFGSKCGTSYDPFHQHWNITVDKNKPPVEPVYPPKEDSPVIRILQLTDIHYDPLYTEGLSNDCGEPLCCRPPNAKGSGETAAGPWGDYNCDVPNKTIENLFQFLQSLQDQFDWVYWTGDMPSHDVWTQTRTGTLNNMKYLYDLFEKYLPDKMVFPTLGNHDTAPVNGFPPPFIKGNHSFNWIIEPAIGNWSKWLSNFPDWNTTQATIRRGGFYNVKVRDGLRVIGLQTTYTERGNYWLLINSTDPAGQLQWLADSLLAAEKAGDKVHIIGHHPPGMYSAITSYGYNYNKIVNRFESTIVGQFFGHTHTDIFKIFLTEDYERPTNILYVSPGVTSFQGLNYGFRIYTIDGDYSGTSHALLDHETYIFDLDQANKYNNPEWVLEYSAKQSYNLTSLQPTALFDFWKALHTSDDLIELFIKHWSKSSKGNNKSKSSTLCEIVTTTSEYNPLCNSTESFRNYLRYLESFRNYNEIHQDEI